VRAFDSWSENYKGGAQAINDLMAGQVDLIFESLKSISSTAKAGSVRRLAVPGAPPHRRSDDPHGFGEVGGGVYRSEAKLD
jgi:tripartite-type tricarboxylate transporter receptor subunit TctC